MVARTAFANTALGTHTFSTSACPEPARAGTECVYWRGRVGPFGPPLGLELTNLLQIFSAKTKGALCRIFSAFVAPLIVSVRHTSFLLFYSPALGQGLVGPETRPGAEIRRGWALGFAPLVLPASGPPRAR